MKKRTPKKKFHWALLAVAYLNFLIPSVVCMGSDGHIMAESVFHKHAAHEHAHSEIQTECHVGGGHCVDLPLPIIAAQEIKPFSSGLASSKSTSPILAFTELASQHPYKVLLSQNILLLNTVLLI